VPDYRIYILNIEDHIIGVESADHITDDAALAHASELVTDEHNVEVWNQARFVGRFASEKFDEVAPTS
jgi:hypothetical protein